MAARDRQHWARLLVWLLCILPWTGWAQYKICVDPGHGGSDPGAVACSLKEKDVNLQVSLMLKDLLAADSDFLPVLTRSSDKDVSLQGRCDYANDHGAHRFVSIHCNAFNGSASGIETFCYTYGSTASFTQRNQIQSHMVAAWPALPDRGGKTASYYVVKNTSMPSTLSELAFLDKCSLDATYLASATKLQQAAAAHHQALRKSLGLSGTGPVDPVQPTSGMVLGVVFEDLGVGTADMSVRIPGATVTASNTAGNTVSTNSTSPDAAWALSVPAGTYTVTANANGYWPASRQCPVLAGMDNWCSVGLVPEDDPPPANAKGTLLGVVFEERGSGTADTSIRLFGAKVTISGENGDIETYASHQEAIWSLELPHGEYLVTVEYPGYWPGHRVCHVVPGIQTWCSVGLFTNEGGTAPTHGILTGMVYQDFGQGDANTSVRLPGAKVSVTSETVLAESSSAVPDAVFNFPLGAGLYTVQVSKPGFYPNSRVCQVTSGETSWCSVGLQSMNTPPLPSDILEGPDSVGDLFDVVDAPEGPVPDSVDASGKDVPSPSFVVDDPSQGGGGGGFGGSSSCSVAARREAAGSPASALLGLGLILVLAGLRRGQRWCKAAVLSLTALLVVGGCRADDVQPGLHPAQRTESQTVPLSLSTKGETVPMIVRPFVVSSEEGLTLPQFSPDGKTLLASSETFDAVYLLSTSEPGQATLLQSGTGVGYYPRWSPDGRCVEVRHAGQRRHDVPHDSVPVDTAKCGVPRNSTPGHWVELDDESVYLRVHRQRRKISPDGDRFCCAVLSPSGRMVSFQGLDGGLYLYDWDTDKLQGLGVAHHPSFSAKGRFLVFDRCFDNGKELVACTIELMDLAADSRSPRTILGTPNLSRHPSLSSDHRRISFESQGQLWVGELVLEP